jgi:hypothetical protein
MADNRFRPSAAGFQFKVILLVMGVLLLGFAAQGIFRAGGVPGIKIEPAMPVIGKRTPVKIKLTEPRRGLTHVRVELIQGDKTVQLGDKSYSFASQFAFWGA